MEEIIKNEELETQTEEQGGEVKTYTQEEVLALIQSEADKRVSQALKTQQKKYEKQLSLSKLDDDERAKAEKDDRIAELEEQLAQFQLEKNRSELKSVLSSRGLSAEFADIVAISDDIEESQAKIDKLDKLFKSAVKVEVEKRLAGAGVPKGSGNNQVAITKENASKMTLAELKNLQQTNPEVLSRHLQTAKAIKPLLFPMMSAADIPFLLQQVFFPSQLQVSISMLLCRVLQMQEKLIQKRTSLKTIATNMRQSEICFIAAESQLK